MMLHHALREGARVYERPFLWVETPSVLRSDVAAELEASFDALALDLYESTRADAAKRYRLWSRTLVSCGRTPRSSVAPRDASTAPLPAVWQAAIDALQGPTYREIMSELAGRQLQRSALEIRACAYDAGCFLGPHTDDAEKLATHIIYLSGAWDPAWGGALALWSAGDAAEPEVCIQPQGNAGVLLVRSERSWHGVEEVRAPVVRRSILVHFMAPS